MNSNDINVGLDPTAFTSITGAQLAQMVNGATPSSDRGFVLLTVDQGGVPVIPDAAGTLAFQRYLWTRISPATNSTSVYVWNPNQSYVLAYPDSFGNPVLVNTNWNPITLANIPAGSIQGYQIANATIPATALAGGISLAQISGSGALLTTATTPTDADITNTSSFAAGLTISPSAVTSNKIAAGGVQTVNIGANQVTPAKISVSGAVNTYMTDLTGALPAWTAIPNILTGLANPSNTGTDDGKVVVVDSGADGKFKYVAGSIPTKATIDNQAIPAAGGTKAIAHGFTGIPHSVRVVLHCTANDASSAYVAGDEIDIVSLGNTNYSWAIWVDANYINVVRNNLATSIYVLKKSDGTLVTVSSAANFTLKAYAVYFA